MKEKIFKRSKYVKPGKKIYSIIHQVILHKFLLHTEVLLTPLQHKKRNRKEIGWIMQSLQASMHKIFETLSTSKFLSTNLLLIKSSSRRLLIISFQNGANMAAYAFFISWESCTRINTFIYPYCMQHIPHKRMVHE